MSTECDPETLEERLENVQASVAFLSSGEPGGDYERFYLAVAAEMGYSNAAATGLSQQEAEDVEGEMGRLLISSLDLAADLQGVTLDFYEPPTAGVLNVEQQLLAISHEVTGILPDQRFDGYRTFHVSVDYTPRDAAALRQAHASGQVTSLNLPALVRVR